MPSMMLIIVLISFVFPCLHAKMPSEMMSHIDPTVDPCEDFYHYACGGWIRNTTLTPSTPRIDSAFMVADAHNQEIFMNIIKDNHPVIHELWDSCMAQDTITSLGNQPLQEDLNRINKARTSSKVFELAGEFARTGTISFFEYLVAPDLEDSRYYTIRFRDAELTLPRDYYSDVYFEKIKDDYELYINNLMKLAGFSLQKTSKHSIADIVIGIERQLTIAQTQVGEETFVMKSTDIDHYLPHAFGAYLKGMNVFHTIMRQDLKIYVQRANYFTFMERLVQVFPLENFKIYLAFRMVHSRVKWLGEDFDSIWFKFFRQKLRDQQEKHPREWECINTIKDYLPDLVGKHFYKKTFDKERENNVLEMIKLIQHAMKERIIKSEWMHKQTEKDEANKKLSAVLPLVGQSEAPRSHPPASALTRDNYAANVHTILSHLFDAEMKKLGQQVDRREWTESSTTSNAFYTVDRNTIMFPAGILHAPFFHGPSVHPARNFGAIGTIMGHELTHGFDTQGCLYDAEGNLRQWWSESTTSAYKKLGECFQEQYSAFRVNGHKVNGRLTLDENIADNGGLSIAWDAYRKHMTNSKPDMDEETRKIGDKMFFLAFAQNWCEKVTPDLMQERLVTISYAPSQWRVNGVVMNNKDFPTVFGCKANAQMNPSKKCQLW